MLTQVLRAPELAFFMFWETLWPLALGFLLSAVVQTLVSKRTITNALGADSPRSVALAAALGAASSSCSYAATAVGRALFRRGATFGNAIVFEFASTNLVFELGLLLLVLLGWQFLGAEFAGGILMIAILVVIFRLTLPRPLVEEARRQAEEGRSGRMEGHGAMDMSVTEGPLLRRALSREALTAVSHYFWMDVYSLWLDLGIGFLIAGALAAWVPNSFWHAFFLTDNRALGAVWGPLIGPVIAMVSFVCSIGNVPLAAVLWNGGISFGGVMAFIFADLLILPILDIYRKYYGWRMMAYLAVASYVAMAGAGLLVEALFSVLHLVPQHTRVTVVMTQPAWNYTTVLNLVALALIAVLGTRFLRTGGPEMLRMMNMPSGDSEMEHTHHHHHA